MRDIREDIALTNPLKQLYIMVICPICGKQVPDETTICPYCKAVLTPPKPAPKPSQASTSPAKSNGYGAAGLVLAILGLILGCVPILGWILWALGVLFSLIGVCKRPRGLAIAGLVISCVALIVTLTFGATIATALGLR